MWAPLRLENEEFLLTSTLMIHQRRPSNPFSHISKSLPNLQPLHLTPPSLLSKSKSGNETYPSPSFNPLRSHSSHEQLDLPASTEEAAEAVESTLFRPEEGGGVLLKATLESTVVASRRWVSCDGGGLWVPWA